MKFDRVREELQTWVSGDSGLTFAARDALDYLGDIEKYLETHSVRQWRMEVYDFPPDDLACQWVVDAVERVLSDM